MVLELMDGGQPLSPKSAAPAALQTTPTAIPNHQQARFTSSFSTLYSHLASTFP